VLIQQAGVSIVYMDKQACMQTPSDTHIQSLSDQQSEFHTRKTISRSILQDMGFILIVHHGPHESHDQAVVRKMGFDV
jgi:hypothetical protein